MLNKILSVCILALLGWQLGLGNATVAIAATLTDQFNRSIPPIVLVTANPPQTTQEQPAAMEESPPQSSESPVRQTPIKRQQITYPEPPDVYDYDTLRQYNEEVYGEKEASPTITTTD